MVLDCRNQTFLTFDILPALKGEAVASIFRNFEALRRSDRSTLDAVVPPAAQPVASRRPATDSPTAASFASVIPFSNVDEAVAIANDTEFGLSGSLHAGDLGTGMNIADRMATGHVHVNDQPVNDEAHVTFSGTQASGMGGYNDGTIRDAVTETKWISLQREPREYPFYSRI